MDITQQTKLVLFVQRALIPQVEKVHVNLVQRQPQHNNTIAELKMLPLPLIALPQETQVQNQTLQQKQNQKLYHALLVKYAFHISVKT